MLTEHSFGVRSLAFSSDSQYLATLGDMNDGFLFVWAINLRTGAAKLHSTNKCTSFIRDMCWMGQTLITYENSLWPLQVILTFNKGRNTPCQGLEA
jgi:WD40 repeat protein